MFASGLIAVCDVEPHDRMRWVVSDDRRGLEVALENHVLGDAHKDFVYNLSRDGRLGIPEYFAYDVGKRRLAAGRTRRRLPFNHASRGSMAIDHGGLGSGAR